jgi:hypothetical protein
MVAKGRLRSARRGYSQDMAPDGELILIFGVLHFGALALGAVLFVLFLRSGDGVHEPPEDDEPGGGGNDRVSDRPPTSSPSGGLPLPSAEQAHVRLRGHEKLRDSHAGPARRPAREPARTPHRVRG